MNPTTAITVTTPGGFHVHSVTGWLSDGRLLKAEDFPDRQLASRAYEAARKVLTAVPESNLDTLADEIQKMLEIDPARPFGCSIICE